MHKYSLSSLGFTIVTKLMKMVIFNTCLHFLKSNPEPRKMGYVKNKLAQYFLFFNKWKFSLMYYPSLFT